MSYRTAILILGWIFLSPVAIRAQEASDALSPGGPATLALPDLEGRAQDLQHYRGSIVVVNFWATWCVPCREEMPILVSLQRRYARRGVRFLAVSTDDPKNRDAVARFAHDLEVNFPVWVGATTREMVRWGLGEALPATAVLDPEGRIVGRILGPLTRGDIKKRIDWLLSAPPPLVDRFSEPEAGSSGGHSHSHDPGLEGEGASHQGEAGGVAGSEHDEHGEEHQHGGVGVEGASLVPS